LDAPQFEHTNARAVPHSRQNFRPGSFSVEQFGQVTGPLPNGAGSR
jgi:hypothetical protein